MKTIGIASAQWLLFSGSVFKGPLCIRKQVIVYIRSCVIHLRITIELRLRNFSHFSQINHEKKHSSPISALNCIRSRSPAVPNVPREAHRINLITLDEAEANHCKQPRLVGSVSVLLINGKARNTAVILRKRSRCPAATHDCLYKGEAGYATTRAQVLSCPKPRPENKRSGNDGLSARIPQARLTLESICSTAFAINQLFRA